MYVGKEKIIEKITVGWKVLNPTIDILTLVQQLEYKNDLRFSWNLIRIKNKYSPYCFMRSWRKDHIIIKYVWFCIVQN